MVRKAQLAQDLMAIWEQPLTDQMYRTPQFTIDLGTTEGRSEMLVLTALLAAKVRDGVAERSFLALRQHGLLCPARLAAGTDSDRQLTLTILRTDYRAVVDKASKMEALYANQARLNAEWGGDLHNIYRAYVGDDAGLIAALQGFSHIKRRALWLARELKVQGVWPEAGVEATGFHDSHVRRVLHRLGIVTTDSSDPWEVALTECEQAVGKWFGSDVTPLYLHGSRLCVHDDRDLCRDACPARESCSFWTNGSVLNGDTQGGN